MTAWQFSLVEDVIGEIRARVVCGGDVASALALALTCTYEYAAHRLRWLLDNECPLPDGEVSDMGVCEHK